VIKKKNAKTMAWQIMEDRHATYVRYPEGYYDETDILLLSQHCGEIRERKRIKKSRKKRGD
jgi:hypothetical protein